MGVGEKLILLIVGLPMILGVGGIIFNNDDLVEFSFKTLFIILVGIFIGFVWGL